MRMSAAMCAVAVLTLSVAITAQCAEAGTNPAKNTKTGLVTKVDAQAGKITVMVARELVFGVSGETKILQGEAARTITDIKVGDNVTVEYSFAGQDNRAASKIMIAAPATGAPTAAPEAPAPGKPIVAAEAAGDRAPAGTLAKVISVNYQNASLQDVCADLTGKAGVPVTCIGIFAQKQVTYAAENRELGKVLDGVATQVGSRIYERGGGYRFRKPD